MPRAAIISSPMQHLRWLLYSYLHKAAFHASHNGCLSPALAIKWYFKRRHTQRVGYEHVPLITATPRLAQESTLCFIKGPRNRVYIQTDGFRMPPVACEAVPAALRPTPGAGKITGWRRLTTGGRGPWAVRGACAQRWLVTVSSLPRETLPGTAD